VEFSIRTALPSDAQAIAGVHVASWEGSYRGIMPDDEFEKRPLSRRIVQWSDSLGIPDRTTLVACNNAGEILGFAGGWLIERTQYGFDSYLATLYLRPDVKGQGIGRALLAAIAKEFSNAGASDMALRTLRLNPARHFYEKFGARLVPEGMALHEGEFDDVVYAFDDLKGLVDFATSRST
jgi:GNAT superfamily N-acetyltransferase